MSHLRRDDTIRAWAAERSAMQRVSVHDIAQIAGFVVLLALFFACATDPMRMIEMLARALP